MKFIQSFLFVFAMLLVADSVSAQAATDSVKLASIKVKGVTCSNDLKTIAGNVEKLKGVSFCKAEKPGATTQFEVKFNPALVSEKEIYAAIEGTGGCQNPDDRPYKVKQ